jgi:hypothetical protein
MLVVPDVAGDHGQPVYLRCGGDKRIDDGQRPGVPLMTLGLGDWKRRRENPVRESCFHLTSETDGSQSHRSNLAVSMRISIRFEVDASERFRG